MIGLKVPKKEANQLRLLLLEHKILDRNFKIKRSLDYVFIPLLERPGMDLMKNESLQVVDTEFEEAKRSPRSMEEYLEGQIPAEKMEDLKKSFDIIGEVVILEIPEELEGEKKAIAEAALKFTKRRSVYRKGSEVKGTTRTRELEHLAGEDLSETTHQEFGTRIMLDVKNVYFSPRLATERRIVTDQVKEGEVVLDMFTGVGPFALSIARNHQVKVYATDINPMAIFYLKRNLEINKLQERVVPLGGDVKEILEGLDLKFDRIIMNLPGSAREFLPVALEHLKSGGVVHYYQFSRDMDDPIQSIKNSAKDRQVEILDKRKVKSTRPGEWHVAVDARIC
ncbi:MAG TPA: class I SAM-dependent methyltransferase family protein [Methanobacteriaceae archaeon]|nr:class I SAM-dependent methyltransferase family protein [Methanobacteriaceae archaeon]